MRKLIVGSRGSRLALTQTQMVVDKIKANLSFEMEIKTIQTRGDIQTNLSLESSGEVGLFTREIETELQSGNIDLIVHSLKDLPLEQPSDLTIAAIPKRADPADVLVMNREAYAERYNILPIMEGSVIGTSSPRRKSQILAHRQDVTLKPIRGNVTTRLQKLRDHEFDAVVFASAGLQRLNLELDDLKMVKLDLEKFPPAPGQGSLAIEMRKGDPDLFAVRTVLNDTIAEICADSERKLLQLFGGGCAMPLGVLVRRETLEFECFAFYAGDKTPRWSSIACMDIEAGIEQVWNELRATE